MVPATSAPNAYLARVGPKPLAFGAPPRPLGEVLAKLPPLGTDLPPKPGSETGSIAGDAQQAQAALWPHPFQGETDATFDAFPRLPDNWLESLLGSGFTPEEIPSMTDPTGAEIGFPPANGASPSAITPEYLIRFFMRPGSPTNSSIAMPVPFVPGMPIKPSSSTSVFRQD